MKPKTSATGQEDLFRSRLDQILNRRHPLFRLANTIDWSVFDKELGPLYVAKAGRPELPIRLLEGCTTDEITKFAMATLREDSR